MLLEDSKRLFLSAVLWPLAFGFAVASAVYADTSQIVNVDGKSEGRIFEGVGVCSAGASSKLLIDYEEPYRSEILDLLFKPLYGMGIHHLKVEIGSGTNSTDGTEPSHARTMDELENPKEEYYQRGYEWWLMKEAKKRNKDIILDILAWGAPAWIGSGNYYSQDNADYFVAFIKGAKKYYGLDIDYAGIWNEMDYDTEWIKLYRRTLDENGLKNVKISAADIVNGWDIVDDMNKDPELYDAIDVVAIHYPFFNDYVSSQAAKDCGKPLWSGEDGPWSSNWDSAMKLARIYNRNYIIGKMTKTIIWAPITSFYSNLPYNDPGLMRGNTPWSGHYELRPAFWITAHTGQFAQPGWQYLDRGCDHLEKGGSYVTLKKPGNEGDYSIIIETSDATAAQEVTFALGGGLSEKKLSAWRTNQNSYFVRQADIKPKGNSFKIKLDVGAIYTLTTTTTGQNKPGPGPKDTAFPFPYRDDFESYNQGKLPLYFLDQGGVFEVTKCSDGIGQTLRQMITEESKMRHWLCPSPETIIGDINWENYEVSSDVYIENEGYVAIFGRLGVIAEHSSPRNAYRLKADHNGNWELSVAGSTLANGNTDFPANTWHNLKLKFYSLYINAEINGKEVASVHDDTFNRGMVALGSGWNHAKFDNFVVQEFTGEKPKPKPGGHHSPNTRGCVEPMSDKQCRFSHVRIIESSDARVVVHWRYAPVDVRYNHPFIDPLTGWGDWVDEYYTIYPNAVGVRKITVFTTRPDLWTEFQESIVVNQPGTLPDDNIELGAVSLANMKGESKTYCWTEKGGPEFDAGPKLANILKINLKGALKPFALVAPPDKGILITPYGGHGRSSHFNWWDHWPVSQVASDGKRATSADKPSHSSLCHIGLPGNATAEWKDYAKGEKWRTKIMLHGMTDEPVAELVPLANSWLQAPRLKLTDRGYSSEGYDPTQLAYVIVSYDPVKASEVTFELAASKKSPVVNPAFVIKSWGESDAELKLNGKRIKRGKDFRLGHRNTVEGCDLIVWIKTESTEPTQITLTPLEAQREKALTGLTPVTDYHL